MLRRAALKLLLACVPAASRLLRSRTETAWCYDGARWVFVAKVTRGWRAAWHTGATDAWVGTGPAPGARFVGMVVQARLFGRALSHEELVREQFSQRPVADGLLWWRP